MVGAATGLLFAVVVVTFRANQIVSAVGLNILMLGLTGVALRAAVGLSTGQSPAPTIPVWKIPGLADLPLIGPVKAAGKTPGQLQTEIHDLYVPKYYLRLTATVKSAIRVYYVGGEVRSPGPKEYIGETTVIKAIQTAGDFTDYANKKKVKLTRNGKTINVDCKKAQGDSAFDLQVFPGDRIDVKRRLW